MTGTTEALRALDAMIYALRQEFDDGYDHNYETARAALTASAQPDDELDDDSIHYTLLKLCDYLGVDANKVTWEAATETVEGDVQAVIGNILRAKFGEEWGPNAVPAAEERRQGHPKLVYDKATRSIVTVDTRPPTAPAQPVGYATTEVRRNIFKHRFETICATPNETYPVALYDAPPPSPWRAVAEKFANSVRHLHGSFYDKRALEEYDALVAMQEHNDEDNILEALRPVDEGSQRHPLHRRPEPGIKNTMETDPLGNVQNRPELNQGSASITWRAVADGLAEAVKTYFDSGYDQAMSEALAAYAAAKEAGG